MKHGSIFSGLGGIDLGFERAGIETAWQVERDHFCRRVLAKNFPHARRFSDVRECNEQNLERVDVISGGFPCQDISVAGKQKGFDGSRSRLFLELARNVGELRPTWVLLENVSQLLHSGIDGVLAEMGRKGYACRVFLLGAKEVGASHSRPRAWVLCHRADADEDHHSRKGLVADHPTGRVKQALARSYLALTRDTTRVMNRLKALYRSWAIPCAGQRVYAPRYRSEWLGKISETGVRRRAEIYYQQLDALRSLREQVRRDLLAEYLKQQAA